MDARLVSPCSCRKPPGCFRIYRPALPLSTCSRSCSKVCAEQQAPCTSADGHGSEDCRRSIHRRKLLYSAAFVGSAAWLQRTPKADAKQASGDWSSPGLATPEDDAPKFFKTPSGVKIQELEVGSGAPAKQGDRVVVDYVLRRSNGYFIYSTVEGVSFQPRDVPIGPVEFKLGDGTVIQGLQDVLVGMRPGGRRRALIPPAVGYVSEALQPQPPNYAAKRQVLNHSNEGLLFELQLLKIRRSA